MVRLNDEQNQRVIPMSDLKDGQVAVIIDERHGYTGRIVQRYGDDAITIGMPQGNGWTNIENVSLLVRVLGEGETLTVTNNK